MAKGSGVTNNAVEFLVTLGINSTESKTSIDKFLKTINDKTVKLTFGVNIGDSNVNIKTFLDKQQGKTVKLKFDVDKTLSNTNLKSFVDSKSYNSKVSFTVNTTQSKANFNSFLEKVKLKPLKVDFQLPTDKKSTSQANSILRKVKPSTINTILGIDIEASERNILKEIKKIKIPEMKVVLDADTTKLTKLIKEQEKIIKNQQQASSPTAPVKPPSSPSGSPNLFLGTYVGKKDEVRNKIRKEMQDIQKDVHVFQGSVLKSQKDFIKQLEADGYRVQTVFDPVSKEITKVTATIKNSANEIETKVFKRFDADYQLTADSAKKASTQVSGFVQEVGRLDNKNFADFPKNLARVEMQLENLRHKGYLSTLQFEEFSSSIKNAGNNNDLDNIVVQMQKISNENKNNLEFARAQSEAYKRQQSILAQLTKTENLYRRLEPDNKAEAIRTRANLDEQIKIIDSAKTLGDLKAVNMSLDIMQHSVRNINARATEATKNSMGMVNALKVAMEKFPIWMIASTMFYGAVRSATTFATAILDIDKKMTDLKKVMSEDTDFGAVFDRATQSAETFGKTISETMDAYIEFAKQGFKEDELASLADATLVGANVGDIEAGKMAEYMTASLLQWNMEAEKSMSIVDKWNELSNDYATSVEQLAQGHARAGATARAMNLDFDQLNAMVGLVTASTRQSGQEVGNFVKSVLPRLLSQPAQDALKSLGISLTDSDGNLRDVMQVYKEVAIAVQGISDAERTAVTEGLAGKYHISRMQVLLDDLAKADSMYERMYDSSVNSANSAMNENAVYMQSLEARINLARVEIEKLSLAIGEAFLTEGMVQAIQGFSEFLQVLTNLISKFGVLAPLFSTTTIALALFSRRFRDVTASIGTFIQKQVEAVKATKLNTEAIKAQERTKKALNVTSTTSTNISNIDTSAVKANTVATKTNTIATNANIISLKNWITTNKMAMVGAGAFGIASIGIGLALEFALKKMGEARERQENLQTEIKNTTDAFKNNRKEINDLTNSYIKLEEARTKDNFSSEEQAEYYEVQNKLGGLLPNLIDYEDSYGNKVLISSSAVESKVAMLEKQLEAEEKLLEIQNKKNEAEQLEEANRQVDGKYFTSSDTAKKQRDFNLKLFDNQVDSNIYSEDIKNLQDMEKAITEYENKRIEMAEKSAKAQENGLKGYDKTLEKLDKQIKKLRETMTAYSLAEAEYNSYLSYILSATASSTEKVIAEHKDMSDEVKKLASGMMNDLLKEVSSSASGQIIAEAFSTKAVHEEMVKAEESVKQFTESSAENFEDSKKALEDYAESMKKSIMSNMKDSNGETLKKDSDAYKEISKAVENYTNKLVANELKIRAKMKAEKISYDQAKLILIQNSELEDSISDMSDELTKYIEKLGELSTIEERLTGVSQQKIKDTEDLAYIYENLSGRTDLLDSETNELANTIAYLTKLYPHLVKNGVPRIEQIKEENKFYKLLQETIKLSADGQLSAEQAKTLYAGQGVKRRLELFKIENQANQKQIDVYKQSILDANKYLKGDARDKAVRIYADEIYKLVTKNAEAEQAINDAIKKINSSLGGVVQSFDKTTKSTKDSAKAVDNSIYITDKYAQAIARLNTLLAENNALQQQQPTHSAEYRKHLQQELNLLSQKKKLIEEQTVALEAQIKAGKIAQTGNIKDPSYGTTATSTTKKLSGWNGRVSSKYGNRTDPFTGKTNFHRGIDIAMAKGTRLDANVNGKVIASGSASSQGYSSTYGNIVVIQDNSGYKHLYAHLDKAIAKLGDTITAGQEIGKIGSTGRSTGSHLHYEVSLNGQLVDPTKFAQDARNGTVAIVSTTTQAIDNSQQAIDSAKTQLESLKSELIDISNDMIAVEREIINSQLEAYTTYRDRIQKSISYDDAKLKVLDTTSSRYNKTLQLQIEHRKKLSNSMEEEAKYLEGLISSGKLSAKVVDEMSERLKELRTAIIEANLAIQEANFNLIQNIIANYDKDFDDLEYLISRSKTLASLFEDGSIDQKNEINYQIQVMEDELDLVASKIRDIQQQMLSSDLNIGAIEELEEILEDLRVQEIQIKVDIKDAKKQLESLEDDLQKSLDSLADDVVKSYKSYLEAQRDVKIDALEENKDAVLKAIDDEIDAENKRHDTVMKNLDDELNAYRKIIDAKLKELRRDDSTRTYEMELQELEDEKAELQRQLQNLAFNTSFEGQAKRKELNERIVEVDKQITELQYRRGLELREDNLNDMMELKEDEIENRKEQEDEYHDELIEKLNKRKKATEEMLDEEIRYYKAYYENLINDEKTYQELRQAVLDRNFELIETKFGGMIEHLKSMMPDLEFTVNGTWKSVANTMRDTVIRELENALKLMKELKESQDKLDTSNPIGDLDGSGDGGSLTDADMKVILSKFLEEKMVDQMPTEYRKQAVADRAKSLFSEGKGEGSVLSENMSMNEILDSLSDEDKKKVGRYFKENANLAGFQTPEYNDYIIKYGEILENEKTLTRGDMQVLLAKYMRGILMHKTSNPMTKKYIDDTAGKIARSGRDNGSIISTTAPFTSLVKELSQSQLESLSDFFIANSTVVSDVSMREELIKYAKQMATASLDTGGMIPNLSGSGIDGKGGRFAILHPNEVINNPIETKNLVESVSIIDKIMSNILRATSSPALPSLSSATSDTFRDVNIEFNIEKMNGDKNDLDRFSKMVNDRLLREKGKKR